MISRRRVLSCAAAAVAAAAAPWVRARPGSDASFPQRPISLWVPWPAGGGTDLTLRLLADLAAEYAVLFPGLSRFGGQGPCVDATSPSPTHADTDDAWLLVAGPVFSPGGLPAPDSPVQAWVASADDERWATAASSTPGPEGGSVVTVRLL